MHEQAPHPSRAAVAVAAQTAPYALLMLAVAHQAWAREGTLQARYWIPHAALAAALLLVLLLSGAARRPVLSGLLGVAGLLGLAVWTAVSIEWSPVRALAREEALLTAFFAITFAVALVSARSEAARAAALATVVAVSAGLALGTGVVLGWGDDPLERFFFGRLEFPIGYANALACFWLLSLWPAIALAARRSLAAPARALALGAATALLAAALPTQSKGGVVALVAGAVVFFAVVPGRLRSLPFTVVPLALVALSFDRLTEPYRTDGLPTQEAAIRTAGKALLVLVAIAVLVGLVLALVDRRVTVGRRVHRAAGIAALAALAAATVAGAIVFLERVESPRAFVSDKWEALSNPPPPEGDHTTHFGQLGSARADYWRVALREFRDHPLAGVGARGFGPAYLAEGRSAESPARAHSLWLDVASETGVVGLLLLLLALGPPVVAVARRAIRDPTAAAVLAAAAVFLAQGTVDVIWSFPALGVPLFLLLGAALAREEGPPIPRPAAGAVAAVLVAFAVLALAPPWLSARYADRGDFDRARSLDPLSIYPYVQEARAADSLEGRLEPLRAALAKEPVNWTLWYMVGDAYARDGRTAEARRAFRRAERLNPNEPLIDDAIEALAADG